MDNFYKPGDYIDYVNAGSAISAGDIVQAGDIIGVAVNDIAASTGVGPLLIKGIIKVTKTGSQAWTLGQTVYYAGSNTFTTVASGNARAGVAAAAVGSGSGETTGYVLINTTPGLDIGEIQSHIADPASAAAITAVAPAALTYAAPAAVTAAAVALTVSDPAAMTAPAAGAGSGADATTYTGAQCDALRADVASIHSKLLLAIDDLALQKAELDKAITDYTAVRTALVAAGVDLGVIRTPVVALVTDVTAVRTGSEANNTAIDSINAALAAFKVTAAS